MDKINISCPVLQEFLDKYVAKQDWIKISKEIGSIIDGVEYFNIEYNTDTSTHSLSLYDKGMI